MLSVTCPFPWGFACSGQLNSHEFFDSHLKAKKAPKSK